MPWWEVRKTRPSFSSPARRDLGGLIVIDFIDMRDSKHKVEVEKTIKKFTKADKARIKIGKISKFGLIEMSRQRLKPSVAFGSFVPCRYCSGKGMIPTIETFGLSFLRKLSLEALKTDNSSIIGTVPSDIADYLLNKKRREVLNIEEQHNISIKIEGNSTLLPGTSKITRM